MPTKWSWFPSNVWHPEPLNSTHVINFTHHSFMLPGFTNHHQDWLGAHEKINCNFGRHFNTLQVKQNGWRFTNHIFKLFFWQKTSPKFYPRVQLTINHHWFKMAWHQKKVIIWTKWWPTLKTYVSPGLHELTHCYLVMPYGDINLRRHWFRLWLAGRLMQSYQGPAESKWTYWN